MTNRYQRWWLGLVVGSVLTVAAEAALLGRLPATPGGTDYQAAYDDVLDITWVTDADLNGIGRWPDMVAWAEGLELGGANDWRLASMSVSAGVPTGRTDSVVDCETATELACRDNELGYMYYYNLPPGSGPLGRDKRGTQTVGDVTLTDIQTFYWSGTEVDRDDVEGVWTFLFSNAAISQVDKVSLNYGWAVRDGDIGLPSAEDVVVDFGSIALWAWMNDANWLKLNNGSPDRITTGDMDGNGDDDVIADFASTLGGIFVKYNLGGWTQLANVASEQMTSGDLDNNGQDDVVIDAGASGLWARMNDSSWLKLNNASPEQVVVGDMDNNGADDVIGDFGVDGIFVKRNLGAWVKLHNSDPEDMSIGNLDATAGDDLVVDFAGSLGLQARMNDSSWLKLHNGSPDVMTTGDIDGNGADDVLAGFGTTVGGFWQKLNLGGWTQLNANSPDDMVTADVTGNGEDDIVADFGSTIGGLFIKRDQGAWVKQHNTSPDSMAPGELE